MAEPTKEPCDNLNDGCCFCDAPAYKRCTVCGHLVCLAHAGNEKHNCG